MTSPVRSVTMVTEIDASGVTYRVLDGYTHDSCDHEDCLPTVVWEKTVLFGKRPPFRPGGHAFRSAAREQEDVAHTHAGLNTRGTE